MQVDARVFRFAMTLNDASRAAVFQYQGVSQANGRQWVMTATATNDVQMLNVPIVAEVSFDGATLSVRNPSGQTFVWRKSGP